MNKKDEIIAAEFFISCLNKYHSLDYAAEANFNEQKIDPEIDIYAVSKSDRELLRFQIVTREGHLLALFARLRKDARSVGQNMAQGSVEAIESEKWIKSAISEKEISYPTEVKRTLILLIWGEFGPLFNSDYAKLIFTAYTNSEFKGIYYVHLPSLPGTSSHPHDGQIIAIKDILGDHFGFCCYAQH